MEVFMILGAFVGALYAGWWLYHNDGKPMEEQTGWFRMKAEGSSQPEVPPHLRGRQVRPGAAARPAGPGAGTATSEEGRRHA